MKKIIFAVLLTSLLSLLPIKQSIAGFEEFLGEISLFAGNFAPKETVFCEGQILSITQNPGLYSILGKRYGGDGKKTFALPDLREAEKSLGGARYIIYLQGVYPSRH